MKKYKASIILIAGISEQTEFLEHSLEANGYLVTFLSVIEEIFALAKNIEADIAIIDLAILPKDKTTIIEQIQRIYPAMSIILIASNSEETPYLPLNVDAIVSRPFRFQHIEQLISERIKSTHKTDKWPPSILVVDDDDIVRTMLIRSFKISGYNALGARDGQMAIDIINKNKVAAVITDINMPYMDGISLLRHLKTKHPDIKVILMTGYYSASECQSLDMTEPDGFIMKPFRIQTIIKLLSDISKK